jgi:hypothetical protein
MLLLVLGHLKISKRGTNILFYISVSAISYKEFNEDMVSTDLFDSDTISYSPKTIDNDG